MESITGIEKLLLFNSRSVQVRKTVCYLSLDKQKFNPKCTSVPSCQFFAFYSWLSCHELLYVRANRKSCWWLFCRIFVAEALDMPFVACNGTYSVERWSKDFIVCDVLIILLTIGFPFTIVWVFFLIMNPKSFLSLSVSFKDFYFLALAHHHHHHLRPGSSWEL